MSQNMYHHHASGRGGAGNYYNTTIKSSDDSSTKPPSMDTVNHEPVSPSTPALARSGRGGAGNIIGNAHQKEVSMGQDVISAAVNSGLKEQRRSGHSGRGGVGNYNTTATTKDDATAAAIDPELEKSIVEAVDSGLRPPDRVHKAPHKVREDVSGY